MEAQKEYYLELIKQQLEIETQRQVLEAQIAEASGNNERELKEALEELNEEGANVNKQIEILNGTMAENTETETAGAEATKYKSPGYPGQKWQLARNLPKRKWKNAEALMESGQVFTEEEAAQLQSQIDAQNAAKEEYARVMEERVALATDAFNRIDEGEAISVQSMVDNLNANAEATEEWTNNMALLADSNLDQGFLEELRQKGPEAGAQVAEMVAYMQENGEDSFTEFNTALEGATKRERSIHG